MVPEEERSTVLSDGSSLPEPPSMSSKSLLDLAAEMQFLARMVLEVQEMEDAIADRRRRYEKLWQRTHDLYNTEFAKVMRI